jgi:hypothetical protein
LHGERSAMPLHTLHSIQTLFCLTPDHCLRALCSVCLSYNGSAGIGYSSYRIMVQLPPEGLCTCIYYWTALHLLDPGSTVHIRACGFQVLGTESRFQVSKRIYRHKGVWISLGIRLNSPTGHTEEVRTLAGQGDDHSPFR